MIRPLFVLLFAGLFGGCTSVPYPPNGVTIYEVRPLASGVVQISYSTTSESMYHCPGVGIVETQEAVDLQFVRAHTALSADWFTASAPKVAQMPSTGDKLPWLRRKPLPELAGVLSAKVLIIQNKGKAIYVVSGGQRRQIYSGK
jgi:hypothetical protein